MNSPKLSVIIPCYNAEKNLRQCLDSVLCQIPPDAEIICVNDGSRDATASILRAYAAGDNRIQWMDKPNGGVASARNAGLELVSGEYIAWVDSDDYVSGDWYSHIQHAMEQNAPDVIVMDSVRFGNGPDTPEIYGRPGGFVDRDVFVEDIIRDIRMLSGLPNKVMKAALFEGVRFDTGLPILEDYAAMPQLLEPARTVYYIPQCLYHYRQVETSLLHQVSADRAFCSVEIALKREKTVAPRFRRAAVTATAWQAFLFCRNRYLFRDFLPEKSQTRFCMGYVRKHLLTLCRDPELPGMIKVKFVLLSIGLYGLFARLHRTRIPAEKK